MPATDGREGRRSVELVETIYAAARAQQPIAPGWPHRLTDFPAPDDRHRGCGHRRFDARLCPRARQPAVRHPRARRRAAAGRRRHRPFRERTSVRSRTSDLADAARRCGRSSRSAPIWDQHGRVLIEYRIRELISGSTVAMSRTALQQALLDALQTPVHTGQEVAGYEHQASGVRVRLATGESLDSDAVHVVHDADDRTTTIHHVRRPDAVDRVVTLEG